MKKSVSECVFVCVCSSVNAVLALGIVKCNSVNGKGVRCVVQQNEKCQTRPPIPRFAWIIKTIATTFQRVSIPFGKKLFYMGGCAVTPQGGGSIKVNM